MGKNNSGLSSRKAKDRRAIRAKLRAQYGENCYWCGLPMDFNGIPNTPNAPTFEHMQRKRDGGSDKQSNLRLAHLRCNQKREALWMRATGEVARMLAPVKERVQ